MAIQFGDILFSLSVVGSAVGFLYTQVTQNEKNISNAIMRMRVTEMSKLLGDFTTLLEQGEKMVENIR